MSGNLEGQLHHRHLADVCLSSVSESVGSLIGIAMAIHELVELETLAFSTVRYARCHGGGRTVDDSTQYPGSPGPIVGLKDRPIRTRLDALLEEKCRHLLRGLT